MSQNRDFLVKQHSEKNWSDVRKACYASLAILLLNGTIIRPWQSGALIIPGKTPPAVEFAVSVRWDLFGLGVTSGALAGSYFFRRRKLQNDLRLDEELDTWLLGGSNLPEFDAKLRIAEHQDHDRQG